VNAHPSIEFGEGYAAYADGVDGYDAKPYPELTQEMTDWFAGWVAAKNADLRELTKLDAKERHEMRAAVMAQNNYLSATGGLL
jgi:beta-lactamase class D